MAALFAESIRTAILPCSLGLIVPAVIVGLMSGRHALVGAFGAFAGTFLVAWARVSGIVDVPDVVAVGLLVVGMVVIGMGRAQSEMAAVGGMLVGAFAATTWLPCVGREFGVVLNSAPDAPVGALFPVMVYILGILLVVVAAALLPHAFPVLGTAAVTAWRVRVGAVCAALLVGAVVVGLYDDVLGELARLSVETGFTPVDPG